MERGIYMLSRAAFQNLRYYSSYYDIFSHDHGLAHNRKEYGEFFCITLVVSTILTNFGHDGFECLTT